MLNRIEADYEVVEPEFVTANDQITLMTYNIACLPSIPPFQINGKFLKPNLERAEKIASTLINWHTHKPAEFVSPPNIICLQEAFADKVRAYLIDRLTPFYPYNTGSLGTKTLNAGSGLLVFSQYQIVDEYFNHFSNLQFGSETLANKGFMALKLKLNVNDYFCVYNFHLGTRGINHEVQDELGGTTSMRRGVQMEAIYAHIQTHRHKPPLNTSLTYQKTFVCGDFNTALNSSRQMLSLSTGLSNNGYEKHQIKYPGQYALFKVLKHNVPANFKEIRVLPRSFGEPKSIDEELLKAAINENKFIGSSYSEEYLTDNLNSQAPLTRQTVECHVLDGTFPSHDGVKGSFESQIVSLEEINRFITKENYPYAFSDHLCRVGIFRHKAKALQEDIEEKTPRNK